MPPSIVLSSPLPPTDLLFESMTASVGLSALGEIQLDLLSEKPDLQPEDLLGKPVTVQIQLRDFKLFRNYRKWVYCVQYRETDFNFVTRLLEHEGIYWYFEHSDGHHKLILVDAASAHDAAPSCESLPYIEHGAETSPDTECISDWSFSREVRTGKVALTSYDFERPSTDLKVKAKGRLPEVRFTIAGMSDLDEAIALYVGWTCGTQDFVA